MFCRQCVSRTIIGFIFYFFVSSAVDTSKMYFCTAADEQHYEWLTNLIGSIHRVNFEELGQIAVFDLGFTQGQCNELASMDKVVLYTVQMTHPYLLKHFKVRPYDRFARGWYAWKPVVIKQALDMFPYILYIDSGMTLLERVDGLFEHIKTEGYFLAICRYHSIKWMTTAYVIEKFNLNDSSRAFILNDSTYGISAGLQGLTRQIYDNYVLPMYELSKDLKNFEDDGSTPGGFGTGRHDQALFSIYAQLLGLRICLDREKCLPGGKCIDELIARKERWEQIKKLRMSTYIRYRVANWYCP